MYIVHLKNNINFPIDFDEVETILKAKKDAFIVLRQGSFERNMLAAILPDTSRRDSHYKKIAGESEEARERRIISAIKDDKLKDFFSLYRSDAGNFEKELLGKISNENKYKLLE